MIYISEPNDDTCNVLWSQNESLVASNLSWKSRETASYNFIKQNHHKGQYFSVENAF